MHCVTGDPTVFGRIKSGEAAKAVLLDLGGGGASCFGAGVNIGLHQLGLASSFSHVVGLSGGGYNGACLLAGYEQTLLGASLYYEECLSEKFINPLRLHRILDVEYLMSVMRGPKRLDQAAVCAHPTRLLLAATNRELGQVFVDAEDARPDLVAAIGRGAAIPGAYGRWIDVGGIPGIDASVSNPFPLEKVIELTDATDVLVVTNRRWEPAYDGKLSFQEAMEAFLASRNGWRVGALMRSWQRRFHKTAMQVHESSGKLGGTRVAVMWDDGRQLPSFGGTPELVKSTIERGTQSALRAFSEVPRTIELESCRS